MHCECLQEGWHGNRCSQAEVVIGRVKVEGDLGVYEGRVGEREKEGGERKERGRRGEGRKKGGEREEKERSEGGEKRGGGGEEKRGERQRGRLRGRLGDTSFIL